MDLDPKTTKFAFIKLIPGKLSLINQYHKEGKIAGRDVMALIACLQFCNWRTGKCSVTPKVLSEVLGTAQNNVRASLKRLRLCGLLVEHVERGGYKVLIPHPKIFECCNGKPRGMLLHAYYAAVYGPDYGDHIQDHEIEPDGEDPEDETLDLEV